MPESNLSAEHLERRLGVLQEQIRQEFRILRWLLFACYAMLLLNLLFI